MIYLDNASTTKVQTSVVKAMEKYFTQEYGNPSSPHEMGERARKAVEDARKQIAREIGARPWEIIFTSGASESNNLAILGLPPKKVIISSIEHSSVYEPARRMKSAVEIPVDKDGIIDLKKLEKEIDRSSMVSVIHAHNEIGVLQDIRKIGMICRKKGVLFHTDAVQSFGKEPIQVKNIGVDLLSASAHKIGGPKGIGFLYIREGLDITPLIYGGGQEKGLRSGTENVPGIVGFAEALARVKKINRNKVKELREFFMEKLESIGGKINGSRSYRIYNNIHVSLPLDAEKLVIYLSQKGIMCSTGSACESKNDKRSLVSIGLNEKEIRGALRFTLNEDITKKDIDYVIRTIDKFKR
ncbi:cysteine desulfurase [Candidatus Pacearchaeota archaeon]|nr:cysteine desulfurase [Candidatus Pacearchaeota archaeon]